MPPAPGVKKDCPTGTAKWGWGNLSLAHDERAIRPEDNGRAWMIGLVQGRLTTVLACSSFTVTGWSEGMFHGYASDKKAPHRLIQWGAVQSGSREKKRVQE